MADFDIAIIKTLGHEGGYVFDPDDPGGETKFGISKRAYPYVDIKNLTIAEAKIIYKRDYWDKLKCDLYPDFIAEELFDLVVNVGVKQATKIMQQTINLLNRNGKTYSDIKVDGSFGEQTLSSFKVCLFENNLKLIFNVINIFQGKFYVELMQRKPVFEKYIGWFNRIDIIKL